MNNWLLNNGINWNIEQQNVLKAIPNLIVTGYAGSGKTLLAIHLSIKLSSAGFSIGLIVYTKALRTYITHSLRLLKPNNSIKVFFERQWFYNQVEFDYIILDEFQDFSLNDITEIRNYSKEGIYLFGDIEQTLYEKNLDNEKTISIKELNTLENFNKIKLLNNFRIPKHVANLANSVTYNDNNKKSLLVNKELSFLLPEIIRFENQVLEQTWLLEFLKNNMKFKNIGILFNKNEQGGIVHFDEAIFPDAKFGKINVFTFLSTTSAKGNCSFIKSLFNAKLACISPSTIIPG